MMPSRTRICMRWLVQILSSESMIKTGSTANISAGTKRLHTTKNHVRFTSVNEMRCRCHTNAAPDRAYPADNDRGRDRRVVRRDLSVAPAWLQCVIYNPFKQGVKVNAEAGHLFTLALTRRKPGCPAVLLSLSRPCQRSGAST